MKRYRIWFLRFVIILALFETLTAVCNFTLDPLHCFGVVNRFNERAVVIDQRQEKTNRLVFENVYYDAILIGSSRSEPIPTGSITGKRVFNYSVPAIFPDEYLPYLNFARNKRAPQLKKIYLGLDFFGSNRNKVIFNPAPESYFSQTGRRTYRLTNLLSPGPLRAWIKRRFEKDYYYCYDRHREVLVPRPMTETDIRRFTEKRLAVFRENFYSEAKYAYNSKLPTLYGEIQAQFSGVTLIPFTSPVSLPLLRTMAAAGRYKDYEQWLKDIVETFGEVHHFMYANSVTMNQSNFYDADHMYTESAELIAFRMTGQVSKIPSDFGMFITRDTLNVRLAELRVLHRKLIGPLDPL